jgi:myo-inositol-1(or 4)-monophosphatase
LNVSGGARREFYLQSQKAKIMSADWTKELELAEHAARKAGALVMDGFRSSFRVSKKGRFDLVTEIDLACERMLREEISTVFPDHRIVGEEGEETGEGDLVWYLDPIDGTVNFAHGHQYFCISIGFYDGNEGLVGVVHAPALGHTWTACKGTGTFRDGKRCRVSTHDNLEDALCTTGFPSGVGTEPAIAAAELAAFMMSTQSIRRCGSAALDLALVSDGTYDLYWERGLKPWDIGAGCVLVSEAGGRLSGCAGAPFDALGGEIVASNGFVHDAALEIIRQARG